jgi:prepilin-type processing-associated H-X9-DG protein
MMYRRIRDDRAAARGAAEMYESMPWMPIAYDAVGFHHGGGRHGLILGDEGGKGAANGLWLDGSVRDLSALGENETRSFSKGLNAWIDRHPKRD